MTTISENRNNEVQSRKYYCDLRIHMIRVLIVSWSFPVSIDDT